MSSSYRISLDNWLGELDVKAFSLGDVGGSQLPVKGRTKTWEVGKVTTYDLPTPHADSPPPQVNLDLNTATVYPLSTHDVIFCLEVFDYVWNPLHALEILGLMLTQGGTLWVTFPSFYPTHNPIEHDALCYKEFGIRKLAEASGLTIKQMTRRRPETNALQAYFSAERLRAARGYDHAFIGWIVEFTK